MLSRVVVLPAAAVSVLDGRAKRVAVAVAKQQLGARIRTSNQN